MAQIPYYDFFFLQCFVVVSRGTVRDCADRNDLRRVTETDRSRRENPGRGFKESRQPQFDAQENRNQVNTQLYLYCSVLRFCCKTLHERKCDFAKCAGVYVILRLRVSCKIFLIRQRLGGFLLYTCTALQIFRDF